MQFTESQGLQLHHFLETEASMFARRQQVHHLSLHFHLERFLTPIVMSLNQLFLQGWFHCAFHHGSTHLTLLHTAHLGQVTRDPFRTLLGTLAPNTSPFAATSQRSLYSS
eukprot:GHRQ01015608.1.p2 GENE.GHRQ01015608.1~~GHRQ01015608.1.p2  ORF type:complete len:110 (-),score=10.20 GHRQ01015608.1:313-642(-)